MDNEELQQQVNALQSKVDNLISGNMSDEFFGKLASEGFIRIDEVLTTSLWTQDEVTAIYYYMFSTIDNKRFVFSNVNAGDFIKISKVNLASDTFTSGSSKLGDTHMYTFWSTVTPPAPLINGGTYYITNATDDTFQLTYTYGGAALNITDIGTGFHFLKKINIIF